MHALLALAAVAAGAVPSSAASAEPTPVSIAVAEGRILARDIARTSPDGDAVVATLPTGTRRIELSEDRRMALLRNRFPGGRFTLRHRGPLGIVRESGETAQAEGTCFATRTDVPSGTAIEAHLLEEVACRPGRTDRWLAHDAPSRTLFARSDIPAGTYLGRVRPIAADAVAAGASLVFRTAEGPVVIEREVVALQSARAGRALFARTKDGEVLRSTLAGEDEE